MDWESYIPTEYWIEPYTEVAIPRNYSYPGRIISLWLDFILLRPHEWVALVLLGLHKYQSLHLWSMFRIIGFEDKLYKGSKT